MIKSDETQKIRFHYLVKPFGFPKRKMLKQHIRSLFKYEKRKIESILYVFCSDDYILNMNNNFLHHNYYTDIITFNLAEKKDAIIGEIYISIDRVRENAMHFNEVFMKELARVIFHGALHLSGFNDKTRKEIALMRKKEEYYLKKFNKAW